MPGMNLTSKLATAAAALVLLAGPALGADRRPLLISVDDLPVAAGDLHADPAERARITDGLLAVLAKHHVPAVGLVIWGNVKSDADRAILRRWLAAGHELGNHSASHLDLTKTAADAYIADVEAGRAGLADFLAKEGDRKVRFFRYPFLDEGDTAAKLDAVRAYLARSGQRSLPVTIDDQDWSFEKPWVEARRKDDRKAMARVGEEYQESLHVEVRDQEARGDRILGRPVPQILLLHANEVGAAQWDRLFTWLEARGYRFAAADEVLGDAAFAEEPRYVGPSGFGLWDRLAALRRAGDARDRRRGAAQDAVRRLEPRRSRNLHLGLRRGRLVPLPHRPHPRPAAGAGALPPPLSGQKGDGHADAWRSSRRAPPRGSNSPLLGDARPSRVHGLSVAARWRLAYPDQPDKKTAEGLTLLVLRRHGDAWEIVQDASM